MMTKKDFENMAYAIKHSPADRDTFIDMIVDLCADNNARFDEKHFRIASGQVQSSCGCWIFTHEWEKQSRSWNTGGLCHYAEGHPEVSSPDEEYDFEEHDPYENMGDEEEYISATEGVDES